MKTLLLEINLFVLILIGSFSAYSQTSPRHFRQIDSLKKVLLTQKDDTNKFHTLKMISSVLYDLREYESALLYANKALALAEKLHFKRGIAETYQKIGWIYLDMKNPAALNISLQSIKIYEEMHDKKGIADGFDLISNIYSDQASFAEAINYQLKCLAIYEEIKDTINIAYSFKTIGGLFFTQGNDAEARKNYLASIKMFGIITNKKDIENSYFEISGMYHDLHKYDKALENGRSALDFYKSEKDDRMTAWSYSLIGRIYERQKKPDLAYQSYLFAQELFIKVGQEFGTNRISINLGSACIALRKYKLANDYLSTALSLAITRHDVALMRDSYEKLAQLDSAQGNYKMAYLHYQKYITYKDSISSQESITKALSYKHQFEYDKKEAVVKAEQEKKDAEVQRTRNLQYFAIGVFMLLAFFLFILSQQRQKTKSKVEKAYQKLEESHETLKSTQAQLIQSEKMASLGELTAGIAHEIQNPLNFVNNFSEVNSELIDELEQEVDKGNLDEVKALAKDIRENEQKINHHGKRADAIVKGMLQHSRSSNGVKEPTDINALADEYLRLAYHGLRAKDKSFNATLKTDFDETIGKIEIIPQDIGRVFLNLITNAFYAVNEKKKLLGSEYNPIVTVRTRKTFNKVELLVTDNGNGIPQNIVEKIFQPFFTTKPAGEGTGLGLSLSYDIVKAHGGELKVESGVESGSGKPAFTNFIITLPS